MAFAEPLPERLRLRIFPQSPLGGGLPRLETITVSPRAGSVGPGPSDRRMFAIEAPGKRPYSVGPDVGVAALARARPAPVDAVPPGPFRPPPARRPRLPRRAPLRLCPLRARRLGGLHRGADPLALRAPLPAARARRARRWRNAHMGYGYLEAGERRLADGRIADLCLDFDVIAHEVGHALMMSLAGRFSRSGSAPTTRRCTRPRRTGRRSSPSLHLDAHVEELLETTHGDLDSFNRLNRFAEFSSSRQIRLANNAATMWDFARGFRASTTCRCRYRGAVGRLRRDLQRAPGGARRHLARGRAARRAGRTRPFAPCARQPRFRKGLRPTPGERSTKR